MGWNKLNVSFKKLISKITTSYDKQPYEEIGDRTLELDILDIRSSTIPFDDPDLAVLNNICQKYELYPLTRDSSVSDHETYFVSNISGNRLSDFVSDKYGRKYGVILFDNNDNVISFTDPIGWFFDYKTGILLISNDMGYPKPYKITGYRYIGNYLSGNSSSNRNRSVTRVSINNKINNSIPIDSSVSSPNYSFSGDSLNLGQSNEFLQKEINFYLNGVKLINGLHVSHVSPSSFSLNMAVYLEDIIEIQIFNQ